MNAGMKATNLKQGFEGAVLGLPLTDVLQLKEQNRFSGYLSVSNEDQHGRLFFRNGALIHAELQEYEGEEAFYRMLSWARGRFRVEPKVETTRNTIDKPLTLLLLEACRQIDEQNLSTKNPVPKAAPDTPLPDNIATLLDAFQGLPEVCGVVVTNRKGHLQMPKTHWKNKPSAIANLFLSHLATDGEFLALIGRQIGQLLDTGEPRQTAFGSRQQKVISMRNQSMALHVALRPEQPLAEARKIIQTTLNSLKKDSI